VRSLPHNVIKHFIKCLAGSGDAVLSKIGQDCLFAESARLALIRNDGTLTCSHTCSQSVLSNSIHPPLCNKPDAIQCRPLQCQVCVPRDTYDVARTEGHSEIKSFTTVACSDCVVSPSTDVALFHTKSRRWAFSNSPYVMRISSSRPQNTSAPLS